jgi:hypothetical protein
MSKKISVTPLDRSYDGDQPLDRKSYRVDISGDGQTKIVEARVPLSLLETHPRPEEYIEKWFEARPVPDSGIVNL